MTSVSSCSAAVLFTDFRQPFFVRHCRLLGCWTVIYACLATVVYLCGVPLVTSFYDFCVILLGCFIVDLFLSLSGVILLGGYFTCPRSQRSLQTSLQRSLQMY